MLSPSFSQLKSENNEDIQDLGSKDEVSGQFVTKTASNVQLAKSPDFFNNDDEIRVKNQSKLQYQQGQISAEGAEIC